MTLFLTSSPSGCPFEPGPAIPVLDRRNHFLENLRAVWPDHPVRGLAIAADPHAYAQNDEMCRVFLQSFADAHLPLTETRILPHYQFIREHILDGQRMEDIALADSRKRHFLALPDGSYLMCSDGHEALYGKAWYFADGTLEEINEDEDVLPLR